MFNFLHRNVNNIYILLYIHNKKKS